MSNRTLAVIRSGLLVTDDEWTMPGLDQPIEITRFALSVEDAPVGTSLDVHVADETGGSPTNSIEDTIAAAAKVSTGTTGSVPIAANGTIYFRVTQGTNSAAYLGAYIEFTAGAPAGTDFTTLAKVRRYLNVVDTDTTPNALLTELISNVSARMERYMGRTITQTTYTDEALDGDGFTNHVVARNGPIISIASLAIGAGTVDSSEYDFDPGSRTIHRRTNGVGVLWPRGLGNITVTYDAGFAAIPSDLDEACRTQVALEYKNSAKGGGRLGLESETFELGGTTALFIADWLPSVKSTLDHYRMIH